LNPLLKLRLYVSSRTFESTAAIAQVHSLLLKHGMNYALEVLDVNYHRQQAIEDEVPFMPMLIRLEPLPVVRVAMPMANLNDLQAALSPEPISLVATEAA